MGKIRSKQTDNFEELLAELESILENIENTKLSLDDLVSKYGRANECLNICKDLLSKAEIKVKELSLDKVLED